MTVGRFWCGFRARAPGPGRRTRVRRGPRRPASPGWRTRAWSSWSPPSTPVSCWTRRSSTAPTCTPISTRPWPPSVPWMWWWSRRRWARTSPWPSTALAAGADVYLEKPPVTSLEDFTRLLEHRAARRDASSRSVSRASGRTPWPSCCRTMPSASGRWSGSARSGPGRGPSATGPARRGRAAATCAAGRWSTARSPTRWPTRWRRPWPSPAAGRSTDVESVETDLYRANAIDCDDTSVVRVANGSRASM